MGLVYETNTQLQFGILFKNLPVFQMYYNNIDSIPYYQWYQEFI